MNQSNAAQYLPFIKALSEGKIIQFYCGNQITVWQDCKELTFNHPPECYRIKQDTQKYRVALVKYLGDKKPYASTINYECQDKELENKPYFIRWLTDWIEYDPN